MKILTIKIILALIIANCAVSYAQYSEYFGYTDVRGAVVYNSALRDVIDADVTIVKSNRVKSLNITDETGAMISKMTFNEDGLITNFSSYEYNEGQEINYIIKWNENKKMSEIIYTEAGRSGLKFLYSFKYKDSYPESITVDFGKGLFEDYIFSYDETMPARLINKISYRDNSKDSVYMEQLFNYNNEGRLVNAKDTKFESTLDSVYYSGNITGINTSHFKKKKYEINDNRIVKETTIYPSKQLSAKVYTYETVIPDIISTVNYFYKDNGLIDYITTEHGEISLKSFYTYEYYDK